MIHDYDRSYYIGASDTKYVMGRWDTKTFAEWWDVKLGLAENDVGNIYTNAGNMWEGKILDHIACTDRDRQIIVGRLRVNLDGADENQVIEVKTYKMPKVFKVPKQYWQQCQVEMFADCKDMALLVAYGLEEADYYEVGEIDEERLSFFPIKYDEEWMDREYLPRLNALARCLEKGEKPWDLRKQ